VGAGHACGPHQACGETDQDDGVEQLEAQVSDGKELSGPEVRGVGAQQGAPALAAAARRTHPASRRLERRRGDAQGPRAHLPADPLGTPPAIDRRPRSDLRERLRGSGRPRLWCCGVHARDGRRQTRYDIRRRQRRRGSGVPSTSACRQVIGKWLASGRSGPSNPSGSRPELGQRGRFKRRCTMLSCWRRTAGAARGQGCCARGHAGRVPATNARAGDMVAASRCCWMGS
jgi:hypothetical protein